MAPLIENEFSYSEFYADDYDTKINYGNAQKVFDFNEENINDLNRRRRRRVVAFDDTMSTYVIINRDSFSKQELKDTWYNRIEMRDMKDQAREEGRMVQAGILVENCQNDDIDDETSITTIRGLEYKTTTGLKKKRQNRKNAYAAVFLEISYQEIEGITDEVAIANEYFLHSVPCHVAAHMIAKQDERDVINMRYDDRMKYYLGIFHNNSAELERGKQLI